MYSIELFVAEPICNNQGNIMSGRRKASAHLQKNARVMPLMR